MDRDELSTTGNYRCTFVISIFFKVTILASIGREKRLLESTNSSVAYSGYGVCCRDSYEGLEEVSVLENRHYPACHRTELGPIVLVINARTILPQVNKFSLMLSHFIVLVTIFNHY